ncbi:MAG: helix-turn-helix domain-containing protein [Bacillota bacterium]
MTTGGQAGVSTFQFLPHAALRPYIDRIWGWESAKKQRVALPTLLPGTGAEVYFHYRMPFCRNSAQAGMDSLPPAHLLCVRRVPIVLQPSDQVGFVAVRFRAGMLPRFTRIPPHELIDQACPVEELWGAAAKELAGRVAGIASFAGKAALIQSFLLARLRSGVGDALVEQAVADIYRECAALPIERLALRLGIGRRQLERRFKLATGQTPAEVRRLARFQKTARAVMLAPGMRYLDAALAHGYYDQAHFIRDFRELAQSTPQRHFEEARARTHFYNMPWRA